MWFAIPRKPVQSEDVPHRIVLLTLSTSHQGTMTSCLRRGKRLHQEGTWIYIYRSSIMLLQLGLGPQTYPHCTHTYAFGLVEVLWRIQLSARRDRVIVQGTMMSVPMMWCVNGEHHVDWIWIRLSDWISSSESEAYHRVELDCFIHIFFFQVIVNIIFTINSYIMASIVTPTSTDGRNQVGVCSVVSETFLLSSYCHSPSHAHVYFVDSTYVLPPQPQRYQYSTSSSLLLAGFKRCWATSN